MATEVRLPEVGEGIEGGTVISVLVKVGDRIEKDQPVIELETDKAVVEVPSSAAGVVQELKVAENQQAAIGSVLLVLGDAAGAADRVADTTEDRSADRAEDRPADRAAPAAPTQTGAAPPPSTAAPTAASPSVAAAAGGAPASVTPAGAAPTAAAPTTAPTTAATAAPAKDPLNTAATPSRTPALSRSNNGRAAAADGPASLIPAAPSVRRLARELGVDVRQLAGSGVLGRISAADVRAAAEGGGLARPLPAAAPAAQALPDFARFGEVERKPMSGIRKATLRAMTNAWSSVPMVTHFDKADITEMELIRKRFQQQAPQGVKLTPTAILLKVVASALKRFPDFNSSVDAEALEVVHKKYINVGVAVDTEAGLLVPVVRDADRKNVMQLAAELGELAVKARERKLSLDEMQGGNFSISNLGGIGGTGFTPIVNPPDVAILGVSRAAMENVWDKDKGEFTPRQMMPLALSYDHRLIDGAAAARFLRWLCEAIEEPFLMALEG